MRTHRGHSIHHCSGQRSGSTRDEYKLQSAGSSKRLTKSLGELVIPQAPLGDGSKNGSTCCTPQRDIGNVQAVGVECETRIGEGLSTTLEGKVMVPAADVPVVLVSLRRKREGEGQDGGLDDS